MTLDPVFRSRAAVRQIEQDGLLARLQESLVAQRQTQAYVRAELPEVLAEAFINGEEAPDEELQFLQNNFFLVLFHAIFQTLGVPAERLRFYARANLCIKGIVTAGDNLFDDETKMLLPLKVEAGERFASILQLLAFDRLIHGVTAKARHEGWLSAAAEARFHRGLLTRLAEIGALEGSEEGGVETVLTVDAMVEKVHRVRGGALFSLAFIGPRAIEEGELRDRFATAERAIQHLGTAFQLVDDLTDFEFDLGRRSHNILVASALHDGSDEEKAAMRDLVRGKAPEPGMVEGVFATSARRVLDLAEAEGREAFTVLQQVGFWYPPEKASVLVHAIVGIEGVTRMESLTQRS